MRAQEFLIESAGKTLGGFSVKPLHISGEVDEAIGLNAPHRKLDRDYMQDYAGRIKSGTKTKQEKFSGIIHGSNIKAIAKSDDVDEAGNPTDIWDLDDLARQIMERPKSILDSPNAKMVKSATEGEVVLDLTLPALAGIVIDEDTGEFVEIQTCPGAGACQLFCYARKGGYVMFPASSMSAAKSLNFLVNHPDQWFDILRANINKIKGSLGAKGIKLVVRWHDAGDFFSKEYLDMALQVARDYPDVDFYAYTTMAMAALSNLPANFEIQHSGGAKRKEVIPIQQHIAGGGTVKQAFEVPKDLFRDLIITDAKGKATKDAAGRTQFKSPEAWEEFKQRLIKNFSSESSQPIKPETIISYDQMLTIPVGPVRKWNVVVFASGHGDRAANRRDVMNSFLMFH